MIISSQNPFVIVFLATSHHLMGSKDCVIYRQSRFDRRGGMRLPQRGPPQAESPRLGELLWGRPPAGPFSSAAGGQRLRPGRPTARRRGRAGQGDGGRGAAGAERRRRSGHERVDSRRIGDGNFVRNRNHTVADAGADDSLDRQAIVSPSASFLDMVVVYVVLISKSWCEVLPNSWDTAHYLPGRREPLSLGKCHRRSTPRYS